MKAWLKSCFLERRMELNELEAKIKSLKVKQERDQRKIHSVRSSPITVRTAREQIAMRAKQIKDLEIMVARERKAP